MSCLKLTVFLGSKYSVVSFHHWFKKGGFRVWKKVKNLLCVAKFVTENNRVFADLAGKEIV